MELAGALRGADVPQDLRDRAARQAAKRAAARPPPSQEEELASLDTSPSPRFALEDPSWLEFLADEGYAVVAAAATPEQAAKGEELLWAFLESQTKWRRGLRETWSDSEYEKVGSVRNGLMNAAGVGQSDFLWHCRTLPAVKRAFAKIWGTDELLVSFDGANVFRPWHHGFRKSVCGWWHVDQGAGKQGRHCVQGLLSLFDADGTTGGLTVVPRSHLRHAEVTQDQGNRDVDYCTVQPYEPVMHELAKRLVCCRAGDLVLWDSRTVHANSPAPLAPTGAKDRLLRAVAYVCMTPKNLASKDVRRNRRTAYEHRFSTSHWPHELNLGSSGEGPQLCLEEAGAAVQDLVG